MPRPIPELNPASSAWQTCPGSGVVRAFDWAPDDKGYPGACVCVCTYGVLMNPGSLQHDVELVSGKRADVGKVAHHQVKYGQQYPDRPDMREVQQMRYSGTKAVKAALEAVRG